MSREERERASASARAEWIARLVDQAPPLSDEQKHLLAILLPPVDPNPTQERAA